MHTNLDGNAVGRGGKLRLFARREVTALGSKVERAKDQEICQERFALPSFLSKHVARGFCSEIRE